MIDRSRSATNEEGESVDGQGSAGRLDAWVDFNADGSFDAAGEQIFTDLPVLDWPSAQTLTFAVPSDAIMGNMTARFRISSFGGLAPRGAAINGEVEDHKIALSLTQGYGNFIDSGQSLGFGDTNGIALGDLDDDGDLDAYVVNEGDWGRHGHLDAERA